MHDIIMKCWSEDEKQRPKASVVYNILHSLMIERLFT